jgi:hypothetical protein
MRAEALAERVLRGALKACSSKPNDDHQVVHGHRDRKLSVTAARGGLSTPEMRRGSIS